MAFQQLKEWEQSIHQIMILQLNAGYTLQLFQLPQHQYFQIIQTTLVYIGKMEILFLKYLLQIQLDIQLHTLKELYI